MGETVTRADVNARIGRINIRGKQYATVDARVLAFWEMYPDGRIETQLLSDDGDRCIFKATAFDMDLPIATGHAFELRTASAVNKTSYIENCETSAVGRALAFLGIGSNGSIASAEEVAAAIEQQQRQQPAQDPWVNVKRLMGDAEKLGYSQSAIKETIENDYKEDGGYNIKAIEEYIGGLIAEVESVES